MSGDWVTGIGKGTREDVRYCLTSAACSKTRIGLEDVCSDCNGLREWVLVDAL